MQNEELTGWTAINIQVNSESRHDMISLMKSQIDATLDMLEDTIGKFDEDSWKAGFVAEWQPWQLALHAIECLDGYFSLSSECSRVSRFGTSSREMTEQDAPSVEAVQLYLADIRAKVERRVQIDSQRDLSEKYDPACGNGFCVLEQFVYALRHTMHHQGELAMLALKAGVHETMWK